MTIIAEKRSVAENYIKALNLKKKDEAWYVSADGKINLTYAAGHLYTLYEPEDYDIKNKSWYKRDLPVIPKEFLYKPINEKNRQRKDCEKVLKDAVKRNDEIVIATDPDREGEVIARLILRSVAKNYSNISRIWACEGLDSRQVLKGIEERKKDSEYDALAKKGEAQKISDWIFGINLTTAYTLKNNGNLFSVGRCQSCVLRVIYDREIEILLFLKRPYYQIKIILTDGTSVFLIKKETGKTSFDSKEEALRELEALKSGGKIRVTDIRKTPKREKAPKLYDLAQLQVDAFNNYGFEPDRTLEIAQRLYNEKGKISYPRTDSVVLSEEDFESTLDLYKKIKAEYPFTGTDEKRITKENKRLFDSKGTTGHHGIIPSNVYENDSSDDWKVYDLVCRRFLMAGMSDYEKEDLKVYFTDNNRTFVFEGFKTVNRGWKEAEKGWEDKGTSKEFEINEEYGFNQAELLEKFTEPPKHFTHATLIKYMRNPGGSEDEENIKCLPIGTEATQASIIKVLFTRGYIVNKGKHIEITRKGTDLIEQMKEDRLLYENIQDEATARWDRMNEEDPDMLLKNIKELTQKIIGGMKKDMEVKVRQHEVCTCPSCGGKIMKGQKGWYCSSYKETGCKNAVSFHLMGNEITEDDIKALCERGETKIFEGIKKDGDKTNFQFVLDENKNFTLRFLNDEIKICECPKCKGDVINGGKLFKCKNKECDFIMWKNTSGITFDAQSVKKLCEGNACAMKRIKKDNSICDVKVKLNDSLDGIEIEYI